MTANTTANNATRQQEYTNSVNALASQNAAQQQNFLNQNTVADFNNKANTQNLSNSIASQGFNNTVQNQQYENQLKQMELNNAATGQNYEQTLGTLGQRNDATSAQADINNAIAQNQIGWSNANANNVSAGASATNAGTTANNNWFNQQQDIRNQPLAEAKAMQDYRTSLLPNFSLAGQGADQIANTNTAGITQDAYNAQVAAANAKNAGGGGILGGVLGSFAGAGAGALGKAGGTALAAAMISDRRLKSNIEHVGKTPGGHNWYEYDIFGRRDSGVMAQELLETLPDAVLLGDDGFYRVDYSKVN